MFKVKPAPNPKAEPEQPTRVKRELELDSLNEIICDLRRKNLIYKEEMLSLRREIEDKNKTIHENEVKSKILKNIVKFRPDWEANFRETIKLLEHVLDFSSEHNYFYLSESQDIRQPVPRVMAQVRLLLERLESGFECLKEVSSQISESNILENSSQVNCKRDLLSSAKEMKRVRTEKELSISNDFRLDFGFIKNDILKKNYTFDVPTTSEDGSAVSKKKGSKKSLGTGEPKKVIYICSIEQQLSSDKKSYVVDKNRMKGVQNGFIIAEKQEQPEEARKKQLYNNIFIKEKERSFKTVESKELDQMEETERETLAPIEASDKLDMRGKQSKPANIFATERSSESEERKPDQGFIQTVSKDSLREDLISGQKSPMRTSETHKILENFSFNFNENRSFLKGDRAVKEKTEKAEAKRSSENFFQNHYESVKSESSENSNLVQDSKGEKKCRADSSAEYSAAVISKSTNFEIATNYFNLRPVQRPSKTPKMTPKILFDRQPRPKRHKMLGNLSVNQSSITSILTPKIKNKKSFFFEKENQKNKSFKFIKKNKAYFSNSQIGKSANLGKKGPKKAGKKRAKMRNWGQLKLTKKPKLGSASPNNFDLTESRLAKKKTRSSKLFKMNMKSPSGFDSKFRFTNLSNNLNKRTRFKTPKNCVKPKTSKLTKDRTKTFQKKYKNSLKMSLERVFRLKRKKSCNLQRKPYDSFILHVNNKYSNKSLMNQRDLINLSFM